MEHLTTALEVWNLMLENCCDDYKRIDCGPLNNLSDLL